MRLRKLFFVFVLWAPVAYGTTMDSLTLNPTTFANLGTPANGTGRWCSDCTTANPCAGAGSGAFAFRRGGAWNCADPNANFGADIGLDSAETSGILPEAKGGTGANNTPTSGRYLKGDGSNFVTSSGAASGTGSCSGQFVRTLNSDAAPTCETITNADIPNLRADTADADTIADTGDGNPATHTLTPTSSWVELTCNDADTCDITMGEGGIAEGTVVTIVNLTTNACDFSDTAGVSELVGAFVMGQFDTLTLRYTGAEWVEVSRSNN